MIADFLTLCTDICPLISANTAALARTLAANGSAGKAALLEISVDPQRDTPARLRAYQKLYGGPLADWTLLRATPADTAKLWKFFGVEYQRVKEPKPAEHRLADPQPLTYDVQHSDDRDLPRRRRARTVRRQRRTRRPGKLPPGKLVQFLDGRGPDSALPPGEPVEDWTVAPRPPGLQLADRPATLRARPRELTGSPPRLLLAAVLVTALAGCGSASHRPANDRT